MFNKTLNSQLQVRNCIINLLVYKLFLQWFESIENVCVQYIYIYFV